LQLRVKRQTHIYIYIYIYIDSQYLHGCSLPYPQAHS
jgi:hypothetical protein